MKLYMDPVQVSKMLHRMRTGISELRDALTIQIQENAQLQEENMQLRNKPTDAKERIIVMQPETIRKEPDFKMPVDEWNTRHFIHYYMKLYKKKYGNVRNFNTNEYKANPVRMKAFWHSHSISREDYKKFIDWLFKNVFNDQFVPLFGHIVSAPMLDKWKATRKSRTNTSLKTLQKAVDKQNQQTDEAIKELVNFLEETEL